MNQLYKNGQTCSFFHCLIILPVFDVDVCLLGAVGVDHLAALDEDAVALDVVHVLQRRGGRHLSGTRGSLPPAISQCSVLTVK